MKHVIHINQHLIGKKDQNELYFPAITCKSYKSNTYCNQVDIICKNVVVCSVKYQPDFKNSVWIEDSEKNKIIVSKQAIKSNLKNNKCDPVISLCGEMVHNHDFMLDGEVVAKLIYSPEKPLGCGARVWLETECEVRTFK